MDAGAFYSVIPQTEGEVQLQLREKTKAKERYCERQRHASNPANVAGTYVALCSQCKRELDNHLLEIINRHKEKFKAIEK